MKVREQTKKRTNTYEDDSKKDDFPREFPKERQQTVFISNRTPDITEKEISKIESFDHIESRKEKTETNKLVSRGNEKLIPLRSFHMGTTSGPGTTKSIEELKKGNSPLLPLVKLFIRKMKDNTKFRKPPQNITANYQMIDDPTIDINSS